MAPEDETPEDTRAQDQAENEVRWALRTLAANILRVTRGAGKPYLLVEHAADFLKAVIAYQEVSGHPLMAEVLSQALDIQPDRELNPQISAGYRDREEATHTMVRGALQIAAARLMEQRTQRAAGESELHQGMRSMEQAQQLLRQEWERESRPGAPTAQERVRELVKGILEDGRKPRKK